jgi:hypothetical protein
MKLFACLALAALSRLPATSALIEITSKACTAATLGIQHDPSSGAYYFGSDDDMKKAVACTSIDYISIGLDRITGCGNCTQETFDSWQLSSVTGKSPAGFSLIFNKPGQIMSYRALDRLTGPLSGGIWINGGGATSLDGFQGLTSVDTAHYNTPACNKAEVSLVLTNNGNLKDASALGNISFTSTLWMYNNPKLNVFGM